MPEEHKRSKIELIKEASRGLRGNIGGELVTESSHFSKESVQLLKFHGIYQQEDRDQRKIRRRTGREKAYQFMVRIKNPGGGRLTPEQWVVLDDIADLYGEGSMRITTRQGIQFHGVGKVNLKETIQYLDRHRVSTFGACGDGNRNTMACPVSGLRKDSCFDGGEWAARIAERFALGSSAYFEIWLDGEKVEQEESEPLYGKTYLPRKFKIAVGDPHDNCVDLLSNDVGLLPVLSGGTLEGFDVFVGGGLGSTHLKAETYPRLADPLGFVLPAKTLDLLESIILTQRDLGNREDRRQARMKYLVEKLGIAAFRREVESRLGERLLGLRPWSLGSTEHHLGWHQQRQESRSYLGIFVENGRVEDRHDRKLKTGLRALIELARPTVLLTPNQDLILADIPEEVGRPATGAEIRPRRGKRLGTSHEQLRVSGPADVWAGDH
ncbi:MAG: NADPH-dependent assimilatory sulfite reductase hemoprotein subunit [Acidobacteriota bacterium]